MRLRLLGLQASRLLALRRMHGARGRRLRDVKSDSENLVDQVTANARGISRIKEN